MEAGAFGGCSSLTSLTIPDGVTGIWEYTFTNCSSLTSVNIPDGITGLWDQTFFGCSSLKSLTIPESVTSIWDGALSGLAPNYNINVYKGSYAEEYVKKNGLNYTVICEHKWNNVYTTDTKASCTKEGSESIHCSKCGAVNTATVRTIPMTGHNYGDWEVMTEPTCKDPGLRERKCANCGDKQSEPLPVTGNHVWNAQYTLDMIPTYNEEGSESIHCSVCGTIKPGSARTTPRLRKPLSLLTVSGIENRIFNGKKQILDLVVIDESNILTKGIDYTVSYENNVNVGIAKVTITGIGDYKGTCTRTFPILPAASAKVTCTNVASGIKVSWAKVEGATSYYVYRNDRFLFRTSALEVTDKEVKYDTGTRFTYRVIASAKGVGNSTKSRTAKMYRLWPVGIKSLTNPASGRMTVTYDKCSGCYGYVVRYGLKKDLSDANVVTVKGEDTLSRTFSGMKKGKTYYVQVRTYMLEYGVRYYSGYCTTKTLTIKK